MRQYQFPVVIEYDPAENVYLAECPMLPGCYTDGETYEEALINIRDAIQLVIESHLPSSRWALDYRLDSCWKDNSQWYAAQNHPRHSEAQYS